MGDTLAQTSLILALTDLGRICRSMWSICSPILAAISGSSWLLLSSGESSIRITSPSEDWGSPPEFVRSLILTLWGAPYFNHATGMDWILCHNAKCDGEWWRWGYRIHGVPIMLWGNWTPDNQENRILS